MFDVQKVVCHRHSIDHDKQQRCKIIRKSLAIKCL